MHLFKELVRSIVFPYPFGLLLLGTGVLLLWGSRRQRLGRVLATAGFAVLLVFSMKPFPLVGMRMLEDDFASYAPRGDTTALPRRSSVAWVAVLGGSKDDDPSLPPNDRLRSDALYRIVEGIRQLRLHPRARLLLSGGSLANGVPPAEVSRDVAVMLGVDPARITLAPEPLDTAEEARVVREIVGTDTVVLVTSARHMPRAEALFAHQGVYAIPAPTAHRIKGPVDVRLDWLYPSPHNLVGSELVFYEVLGRTWAWLRGQTD